MSETEFIPSFNQAIPERLSKGDWLSSEEPQVLLFQGMRGSGKGVAVDNVTEKLYKEGLTILHIWGARSLENLFWAINLNCREKYAKMKFIVDQFFDSSKSGNLKNHCLNYENPFDDEKDYEKYLELAIDSGLIKKSKDGMHEITNDGISLHNGELLHCKCHKSYPIILMVPNYIEFDLETIDRFNGVYWKDFDEYKEHRIDITTEEKKLLLEGKLKKPTYLQTIPLIKIKHITPPTTPTRREKFQEEFTEIVLQAREERRIVVMNPALFEIPLEKFETLAEIMKLLKYLMNTSGHFMPLTKEDVGKDRKYWTKKQKSWHKIAVVINEVRSVAPSSKLSGEKEAGKSKRAIYDFIPEARHMKCWFIADYQSPEDLFSGIRHQANIITLKRASRNILGGDWGWVFEKIDKDRMNFVRSKGFDVEKPEHVFGHLERNPGLKKFVDERRPEIGNLPSNKGYLTFPNNEIKLERFDTPSFHHKTSLEDFQQITGIRWIVNLEKKTKTEDVDSTKELTITKKKVKEEILEKIVFMKDVEKKSFKKIRSELMEMEKNGMFPTQNFETRTPTYFNNLYLRKMKNYR